MESQNSDNPNNNPVVPIPPLVIPVKTGILSHPLLLVFLFIVILGLGIFLGRTFFSSAKENSGISAAPTVAVAPTSTEATSGASLANWKTYSDKFYSFRYPSDWSVAEKCESYCSGQVDIKSATKVVVVGISTKQAIYGGITPPTETDKLNINIDGERYSAVEYDNSFVDFTIKKNNVDYHILFGTGYPAGNDALKSIEGYKLSKSIIIQILSTFKFTEKTDNRILITQENIKQVTESIGGYGCHQDDFNFEPPTEKVEYKNIQKGINFSIPFNPKWGTDKFRINPYDVNLSYGWSPDPTNSDGIVFGHIGTTEGCGLKRQFYLTYIPARSVVSAIQTITDQQKSGLIPEPTDFDSRFTVRPTELKIDNFSVVKYQPYNAMGLGIYHLEVIGKKYNYHFIGTTNFTDLEEIAKTIKLL